MKVIKKIEVCAAATDQKYSISAGGGLLSGSGAWARATLGDSARKVVVVSNPKVFGLYGTIVVESLANAGFDVSVWLMGDGERFKNLRSAEKLIGALGRNAIGRTDALVALGGGVVGDLAGFAAAIHLRGIRFLQVPTTLLAMIDSSVGGKTGVNTGFGKNLLGAFHQPAGVLIDVTSLATLPRRELVAGFCEAAKHCALDRSLLERTRGFLQTFGSKGFKRRMEDDRFVSELGRLIAEQVAFKARIVAGDQFEDVSRTDSSSRKVLNFGHTLAHALEKATGFRYFKHGEAVGLGVLFAARLSNSLELLDSNGLNLLNDVVRLCGKLPDTGRIDAEDVIGAFVSDKKTIAGNLQWILLKGIGQPLIVANDKIPEMSIRKCLEEILARSSG